jgi:hypothetical protein
MCINRLGKRFRNLIVAKIIILTIAPKGTLDTFQVSILIRSLGTRVDGATNWPFVSELSGVLESVVIYIRIPYRPS